MKSSLYDAVPSDFPVRIDIGKRPLKYELRCDVAERAIVSVYAAFFLVGGVLFAFVMGLLGALLFVQGDPAIWVGAGAAAVYVLIVGGWWLWPMIHDVYRIVKVSLSETQVDVKVHDLLWRDSWSLPIKDFEGVAILNLGTKSVGFHKAPVASVVLKHRAPKRSVPFIIDEAKRLGKGTVTRNANHLGLPALEGIGDGSGEAAYPPGTILVNGPRGLRVRLLFLGFLLFTLGCGAASAYQYLYTTVDPVWPIMFALFLPVCIAIYVYAARYVTRMTREDRSVWVQTAAWWFATHKIDPARIAGIGYSEGYMWTPKQSVHTPYMTMRVDGYRLPFMIDMQAKYVNENLLRSLNNGRRAKR